MAAYHQSDQLACLTAIMNDPFCFLDEDGMIRCASDTFLQLIHPESAIDLPVSASDLFSPASRFHPLLQVIRSIPDHENEPLEVQIPVSEHRTAGMIHLLIAPIRFMRTESGRVSGTFISVPSLLPGDPRRVVMGRHENLFSIIHEILILLRKNRYSARVIQHLLSRLGPVLQMPYLSFLEFSEDEGVLAISESSLWSLRYGFIVGEESEDSSEDSATFFYDLTHLPPDHGYHVFTIENAPAILQQMMERREIRAILLIPVSSTGNGQGCITLWNTTPHWSGSEISALLSLAEIIGEFLTREQIESELTISEDKFRGVIEHIGDMYYRTDKSGYLQEVSPSMAAALEFQSPADLTGKPMESLLKDPEVWPIFLSDVLNRNGVQDYELVLRGNAGRIITGSVSCRLMYDDEGYLRGIEGVIRDISRRRQYEELVHESEWKIDQAQKIARLGVWSYDLSSRKFRVSSEIFSILSIPPEKSLITLDDLILMSSDPDKAKFSHYFEKMVLGGNEFGFEFRIDLPDERFRYIRIKGQPRIRGGEVTGSFGIIQDITERKEVEQHLLKYAYQLEQKTMELDAMRTQLLDMNRELDQRVRQRTNQIEELLRQKDEFIIQIGHDLKTPLTPLVAILPVIRKRVTDPEICELLDVSIEDVSSIKAMISTILDLARMNALYTVSDLQEIVLYDALEQIIADNTYLIHQKSLMVLNQIPPGLSILISPVHLETLMTNLIGNAVKYSFIDGSIYISAYEKNESVVVVIRDEGIGIEPDVLPRIFDAFYRADSSRHDRESHGLGLAIAQRVADIYGGIIRAESPGAGLGSTFSVQLKKDIRKRLYP